MTLKHSLLAFIVVAIWGINFSFIEIGLRELPPILFSALRFTIVAFPAIFFIPFPKTSVWNVLGVGLFLGIFKFALLFIAMKDDATPGIASLLLQAQVFFTIGLGLLIFKEQVSKSQWLGIALATGGFSCFFIGNSDSLTLTGLILLLSAAFFWGLANILLKRVRGVNLLHFMVWVSVIPPIPLLILSYFLETDQTIDLLLSTTSSTWLALIYVSYLSTLIAFALWAWLLKTYPSATVAPFALLIPVVGITTSALVFGESFRLVEIIGGGLILLGLILCVVKANITNIFRRKELKPQAIT